MAAVKDWCVCTEWKEGWQRLRGFPSEMKCCMYCGGVLNKDATLTIEQIARACFDVNKAYCEFYLNDFTQPEEWSNAPAWVKESILEGVSRLVVDPDRTPEESHESWMEKKLNEGWKYGPVKDIVKKEHPCILPYHDLPREQQLKDHLFKAVVISLRKRF